MSGRIDAGDLVPALRAMMGTHGLDTFGAHYDTPQQVADAIVAALTADDWCESDGSGYCGTHDQPIAYYVDTMSGSTLPTHVLERGTFDPEDEGYPVCHGAYRYDPGLDR